MFLRSTLFILVFAVLFQSLLIAQSDKPFYKNGTYDESIPTPEKVLGLSIGDRPIRYTEVVTYLKILTEKSSRVKLIQEGETYQGRKLYYLVVTSEKNFSNIDKTKTDISKLSDPRLLESPNDAETIINSSPAVAMMMYSIHGNETSGTDAAMALAYQLAAGTDTHTKELLNDLVICIYPMENP
ncbi:MAG: hypothetical protein KAQ90_07905, partial [Melioribacteraceae bacterium]|nr:hypothetical protein [Melioribacteraceae bacterium]